MAEVVKIENSEENEDVLKKAQLGDMIEFTRGVYSHWAIYVGKLSLYSYIFILYYVYLGNGYVIHRWGEHDGIGRSVGFWGNILTFSGTQFDKATILQSKVSDVLKLGGKAKINNYLDKDIKYVKTNIIIHFKF